MRPLYILSLAALLAACAGEPPAEPAPAKPVAKPAAEQPLPAYMRALDGQLLGAPPAATWSWPCWRWTTATARCACSAASASTAPARPCPSA